MLKNGRFLYINHSPVVMGDSRRKREVTCEGRFSELRCNLGTILNTQEPLSDKDLSDAFELLKDDLSNLDGADNYFDTAGDQLRPSPRVMPAALVPLLARKMAVPDFLLEAYLIGTEPTVSNGVIDYLRQFNTRAELTDRVRLGEDFSSRYKVRTNFGIGNRPGEAVVSDAPFNIEILHHPAGSEEPYQHLSTVGFWYRKMAADDVIVVDQIQDTRTDYPKADPTSVLGLKVACEVARIGNINQVWLYPAQKHPLFRKEPAKRARLIDDFKKIYDDSARALKFDGDESTFYVKNIKK